MNSQDKFPEPSKRQDPNYHPITENDRVNARPATRDEVAYRNGYTHGRQVERVNDSIQQTRENNSAATGVVIGVLLAAIAGIVLAMFYFLPQNQRTETSPAASPTPQSNTTQRSNTEKTTVIERVREVAPAPQRTEIIVPNPAQSETQPNSAPTSQTAPGTAPGTAPSSDSSATQQPSQSTQTDGTTSASPAAPDGSMPSN